MILIIGVRGERENRSIGSQSEEPIEGNRGDIHVGLRYLRTFDDGAAAHRAEGALVAQGLPGISIYLIWRAHAKPPIRPVKARRQTPFWHAAFPRGSRWIA